MEQTLERGTQIVYVPDHAQERLPLGHWAWDPEHPDVEFGFVTSPSSGKAVFCRYWRKGEPGVLRTVANSESTPVRCLVRHNSVRQGRVEKVLQSLEETARDLIDYDWECRADAASF